MQMKYPEYCYYRSGKLRSERALELAGLLEGISKDPEFIGGVLNQFDCDEEIQMLINYINNGEDISYENVILTALELHEQKVSGIDASVLSRDRSLTFWCRNCDWWKYDENGTPVLLADAPEDAQKSYQHYLDYKDNTQNNS